MITMHPFITQLVITWWLWFRNFIDHVILQQNYRKLTIPIPFYHMSSATKSDIKPAITNGLQFSKVMSILTLRKRWQKFRLVYIKNEQGTKIFQ